MRTAVLIAAAAAALSLSACNRTDDAATDGSTEAADATAAADAAGASADTAATSAERSGGAYAAGSAGSTSGEKMDPAPGGTVSDGAMAPGAVPHDTAGNNVTETERRLNPPVAQ